MGPLIVAASLSGPGRRTRADGSLAKGFEQRDLLESTGVNQIYEDVVDACISDLGLDNETATRLFGQTHTMGFPAPNRNFLAGNVTGRVNDLAIH